MGLGDAVGDDVPDLSRLFDDNDNLREAFGDRNVILSACLNEVFLYAETSFTSGNINLFSVKCFFLISNVKTNKIKKKNL